MLAVLNKELKSYFNSITGYIFMGVFLLIIGIFFAMSNIIPGSPDYNSVLSSANFIFLILVPMLTMKLLSEEAHQKTDQLLLTSPLKVVDIVLGKFLAAFILFLITIGITIIYPLILSEYGALAGWEIIGNYIGFILLGASFISIGVFISSLTENQVASAVGTFGALLFIWLIDWLSQSIPTSVTSGIAFAIILGILLCLIVYSATKSTYATIAALVVSFIAIALVFIINKTLYEGFTAKVLGWFSLLKRYDNFYIGILDMSSIIYYLSFIFAFLFLTIRMIEKRRWS